MMRISKSSFILILLCLYLLLSNVLWLKLDRMVEGEEAPHLVRSYQLYRTIYYSLPGTNHEKLNELKYSPKQKPWNSFLFYSFVIPSYLIFGISSDVAVITTSLFHLLIAIFTYLIGVQLVSKKVGLLAAFVCSFFPIIFNMPRQFSPNPAFIFFVLLTIYLLLKSDSFGNRKFSILAGMATGFALLLGYTNGTFIAAGYISQIWKIKKVDNKKERLLNLFFSLLTGFIISFWWYIINLDTLLRANSFIRLQFSSLAGSPQVLSLHSLLHYSTCMIYGQIYLLNTILAVLGLLFFIVKEKENRLFAILWIALPYIFFTLAYESKNTRYTMPYLPLLAISISYLIFMIKRRWIRRLLIGLVIIHCFLIHILSSFEFKNLPGEVSYTTGSKICYKLPFYGTPVWGRIKPVDQDLKLEDILRLINDDFLDARKSGDTTKKRYKLMFTPESPYFRPLVAGYYSALLDIPVQIWPLAVRQFDYYISSFDFDYIVLRTANSMLSVLGNTRPQMEKGEKALLSGAPIFSTIFHLLGDFTLCDESRAVVLKKVIKEPLNMDNKALERLYVEGIGVNPESPFLHFEYAKLLKDMGEVEAYEKECNLVEYWYNKNQKDTGYLFLDYRRITESLIAECKE